MKSMTRTKFTNVEKNEINDLSTVREDEWRALIQLPTSLMATVFVVVFATQSPTNQRIYIIHFK